MSRPGDAHREVRQQLDRLGVGHHFGLDPRRSEQQVDDRRSGLARKGEPRGRQPSNGFLLNDCFDALVVRARLIDQGFRFGIARQRDREIGISREPRFRPDRNGQAADQSEGDAGSREVGADLA